MRILKGVYINPKRVTVWSGICFLLTNMYISTWELFWFKDLTPLRFTIHSFILGSSSLVLTISLFYFLKRLSNPEFEKEIIREEIYSLRFPLRIAAALQKPEIREIFWDQMVERVKADFIEYGGLRTKFYLWQDITANIYYIGKLKCLDILRKE